MNIETQQRLHEQIAEACPVIGSSVGKFGVSVTVTFEPSKGASKQQIADAQALIDGFDWSDAATQAWIDAKEPALKNAKDNSAQMLAEIDAFVATASKAEIAELRAEAIASALRQKTLIQAVERLAGK